MTIIQWLLKMFVGTWLNPIKIEFDRCENPVNAEEKFKEAIIAKISKVNESNINIKNISSIYGNSGIATVIYTITTPNAIDSFGYINYGEKVTIYVVETSIVSQYKSKFRWIKI